ncbi:MAG: tetratricopeptide repeat protein [Bacteroidales bacterium]|nr:tetratricopeptide repeat protein [Bacteroidales bacterium]
MDNKTLLPGTTLKGSQYTYKIEKVLGQGTFGITYLATTYIKVDGALGSLQTKIQVAIKEFFMRDINGRNENTVTCSNNGGLYVDYKHKFAKEAENLSNLNHKGVVKVLERFETNNTIYYSMEFCEGGSLNDYIEKAGKLSEEDTLEYTKQIAEALRNMHEKKMLHLDLKPANIMLRANGELVLIDFGLSKQYDENGQPESSTNIGGGTPGYAPLEQANYNAAAGFPMTMDIYALGACMFKMLTGERPDDASVIFNEGFPTEKLKEHNVSDQTIELITKLMSPAKRQRPQDVKTLLALLEDIEENKSHAKNSSYTEENNKNEETIFDNSIKNNRKKTKEEEEVDRKKQETLYNKTAPKQEEPKAEATLEKKHDKKNNRSFIAIISAIGIGIAAFVAFIIFMGIWPISNNQESENATTNSTVVSKYDAEEAYNKGDEEFKNKNYPEAIKWYAIAAEQGHAKAQCYLGVCYDNGLGVTKSFDEAVKWYKLSAEQGFSGAQSCLGWCYEYGKGVEKSYPEAVKWYTMAAEQGDAWAQLFLGECYEKGKGVSASIETAIKWYKLSAEQENATAQEALKRLNANIEKDTKPNTSVAANNSVSKPQPVEKPKPIEKPQPVEKPKPTVEKPRPQPTPTLTASDMYNKGVVADNNGNYEEAVKWYLEAAEQGHAKAQYNLGVCYYNGDGVQQSYVKAAKWYRKAAEQGNMYAQYNLGVCYANGEGVEQSKSEAAKWYKKAAEQGNTIANYALDELNK